MIKRSIAATVLILGLVTVAHANLIVSRPADLGAALGVQAPTVGGHRLDSAAAYADNRALAPTTINDADERPSVTRAASRVIDLPGADAPSQGYTASSPTPVTADQPERQPLTRPLSGIRETGASEMPVAARPAAEAGRPAVKAPSRPVGVDSPAGYRTAKWSGGEGATWKTGRDGRDFSGVIGGCRITGSVGPRGYRLNRSC